MLNLYVNARLYLGIRTHEKRASADGRRPESSRLIKLLMIGLTTQESGNFKQVLFFILRGRYSVIGIDVQSCLYRLRWNVLFDGWAHEAEAGNACEQGFRPFATFLLGGQILCFDGGLQR